MSTHGKPTLDDITGRIAARSANKRADSESGVGRELFGFLRRGVNPADCGATVVAGDSGCTAD